MGDRLYCSRCGRVVWAGPAAVPEAVPHDRKSCPDCGSTVLRGSIPAGETAGAMVDRASIVAQHHVGIDQLVTGFLAAHTRFERAAAGSTPGNTLYPLFEALNWSVAATDKLKSESPEWTTGLDASDRDAVKALRCARNVVHHAWETLIEGTATSDQSEMTWRWRPLDQHSVTEKGEARYGGTEYAWVLEGRRVQDSLTVLRRILVAQAPGGAAEVEQAAARLWSDMSA